MNVVSLKTVGIVLVTAGIICVAGYALSFTMNVQPLYRKTVGGYLDMAYDASTFEMMESNLLKAIDGMHRLGLKPSDYGRAFSWEQTPDYSMEKQYEYLANLVNRTQYYGKMFKANNTSPFTDVYTQSIANVRSEFGRNGPIDWVAYPAWLLKNHGIYYWCILFYFLFFAVIIFGALFTLTGDEYH